MALSELWMILFRINDDSNHLRIYIDMFNIYVQYIYDPYKYVYIYIDRDRDTER